MGLKIMKKNIFILDDDRIRIDEFRHYYKGDLIFIASNTDEAKALLLNNSFDVIFLDHDLGDNNGCGIDIVDFLINNNIHKNTTIYVHSMNPPASTSMYKTLMRKGFNVWKVPYSRLLHYFNSERSNDF